MSRLVRALFMASLVAVFTAPEANAAPITIDTFDTPAVPQVFIGPTGPPAATHSGPGILGTRTLSSSTGLALGDVVSIGGGTFQVFTSANALESFLTYNGFGTQNFSGDLGIQFDFLFLDGGIVTSTEFDVTLVTSTGNLTGTITLPDSATPFSAVLPFTSFSGPGNLNNVTSITFNFNNGGSPSQGADFVIGQLSVAATPEPTSLALFGLVGVAAVWYGRRKLAARQAA